ncbi:MAG: hypothetical protein AB7N76_21920 [Planctomycetota bacterium]
MIQPARHPVLVAVLLASIVTQQGCGVIFGYGSPQEVKVFARLPNGQNVDGLKIKDKDGTVLDQVTPGPVLLHPKPEHSLTIVDERYYSAQQAVTKKIRIDVVILDALTLGIGLLVDYLSGSLYSLDSAVTINLNTKEAVEKARTPTPQPQPQPTGTGTQPKQEDGIWVTHFVTGERVFIPKNAKPCPVCGGLRGEMSPCPHCGVE